MNENPRRIPLPLRPARDAAGMLAAAVAFRDALTTRRSVRDFSDRPVPVEIVRACIEAAAQAPSGANKQPWHFELVGNPEVKRRIRLAAEEEESRFYAGRAPEDWLADLEPLGTDAEKPFLEIAPWLIAVFEQRHGTGPGGEKIKHYYTKESVGLACGFLIAALHEAGLCTLTHTPSPMGFLNEILERPANEKPFLLLVVGHPAPGATVPDIRRKDPAAYLNIRD
ncbi:nitroreductase family protein [bacterium]|nr:nitroreductase family protein [bacterium]